MKTYVQTFIAGLLIKTCTEISIAELSIIAKKVEPSQMFINW